MLSTGLEASPFLDGLTGVNLKRAFFPLLSACLGLFPAALAAGYQHLLLAWFPLCLLLLACASYATQAVCLWLDKSWSHGILHLMPALLPPLAWSPWWADLWWLSALWVGYFCRRAALKGAQAETRRKQPTPRRWLQALSDNPIVHRELNRFQNGFSWGPRGYVLARGLWLLWPGLLLSQLEVLVRYQLALYAVVAITSCFFFARAAWAASTVVARDRDSDLSLLIGSGLQPSDYGKGVLTWSVLWLFSEWLVLASLSSTAAWLAPSLFGLSSGNSHIVPLQVSLSLLAGVCGGLAGLSLNGRGSVVGELLRLTVVYLASAMLFILVGQSLVLARVIEVSRDWLPYAVTWLPLWTTFLLAWPGYSRRARHSTHRLWLSDSGIPPNRNWSLLLLPALAALLLSFTAGILVAGTARVVWFFTLPEWSLPALLLGVSAWALVILWWVVGPAVQVVSHLALRRLSWSQAFSCAFGALAGQSLLWAIALVRLQAEKDPDLELGFYPILVGILAGLVAGYIGFRRGSPQPGPGWRQAWRQARPALALVLLVALLAVAMLGRTRALKLERPEEAAALRAYTQTLVQARLEVPDEENAFLDLLDAWPQLSAVDRQAPEGLWGLSILSNRFYQLKYPKGWDGPSPQNLEAARQEFLRHIPELEKMLAKKEFATEPVFGVGFEARMTDFIRMRQVAQALAVLAMESTSTGRTEEALKYTILGLRWGELLTGRGSLVHEMVGTVLYTLALDRAIDLVAWDLLTPSQRGQLLACLESTRFQPENLVRATDYEFELMQRYFEQAPHSPEYRKLVEKDLGYRMLWVPRWHYETEKVAYTNLYLRLRTHLRKLQAGDYVIHSFLHPSAMRAPDYLPRSDRAVQNFVLLLSKQAGLRTMLLLEAYRDRYGHYPQTLDQLPELPLDRSNQEGRFKYFRNGDSYLLTGIPNRYSDAEPVKFKKD